MKSKILVMWSYELEFPIYGSGRRLWTARWNQFFDFLIVYTVRDRKIGILVFIRLCFLLMAHIIIICMQFRNVRKVGLSHIITYKNNIFELWIFRFELFLCIVVIWLFLHVCCCLDLMNILQLFQPEEDQIYGRNFA